MGPNALTSLVDDLKVDGSTKVLSRGNGAWGPETGRFREEVRALAAALAGYGLRPGGAAAVLGPEGYDTLRADLSILAAGATLVPFDPLIPDDVLRRVLEASRAMLAIASDERQLARILAMRPDLPSLELVLLMAAAPSERKPAAMLVSAALLAGAAGLEDDPACLTRAVQDGDGKVACLIVGSAGETRPIPRNVLVAVAGATADTLGVARGKTVVASLPVSGLERIGAALAVVGAGASLLLPDASARPDDGLERHAADAVLLTVPGLERLHRAWLEDIEAKSWTGRRITRWALKRGLDPQPHGWKHKAADTLALKELRGKLGGKLAALHVIAGPRGGASSDVDAFFKGVGLPVRYFQPEKGAVLAR